MHKCYSMFSFCLYALVGVYLLQKFFDLLAEVQEEEGEEGWGEGEEWEGDGYFN
jgi:hypothetical protein